VESTIGRKGRHSQFKCQLVDKSPVTHKKCLGEKGELTQVLWPKKEGGSRSAGRIRTKMVRPPRYTNIKRENAQTMARSAPV